MTAPNTVPTTSSIFQYPPNFPNGQVADIWNAYFTSLNTAFSTAPGVLGAVAYTVLADTTTAVNGAGLVGWNGALTYGASSIGGGLQTEIAARIAADTLIRNDFANPSDVALGDALIGVNQPLTGAVPTTQHNKNSMVVDLTDFGTVDVTGVTDCSSVVAAAINAIVVLSGSAGGVIHFPRGLIKCNIALNTSGITLKGKGKRATRLIPATNNPVVSIGNMSSAVLDCHVQGMGFDNTAGIAVGATPAVSFIGTTQINDAHRLTDVFIQYFPIGVSITGRACLTMFDNVEVLNSGTYGFQILPGLDAFVNHTRFTDCRSYISGSHGLYAKSYGSGAGTTIGILLDHCDFEYSGHTNITTPNTNNGSAGIWVENIEGLCVCNETSFENNGNAAADGLGTGIRLTGLFCAWFRISNVISWLTQRAVIIDATNATGYVGECRLAGTTSDLTTLSPLGLGSNILVGANYGSGTSGTPNDAIYADAGGRTFTHYIGVSGAPTWATSVTDGMSVAGLSTIWANSIAATMNTLTGGAIGQEITIECQNACTFVHANTSANGFYLPNAANLAVPANGVVTFRRMASRAWVLVSMACKNYGINQLTAGTVTISDTTITSSSIVMATVQIAGGTQGFLHITLSAGSGFTISSTSGTETSWVAWNKLQ